ncbi:hypothetical protein [Dyadobacter sp. 3J3]|uniref:hypothetical protein n=1 Tax=Dyadobacter sp. 3J3 TaxID=2606600 RepID=UPI00135CDF5B|nr:hypothetical protein [Dyadobacter sp. 3J3]
MKNFCILGLCLIMTFSCRSKKVEPDGDSIDNSTLVNFDLVFEKELIRLGIDKQGKEDGLVRYADVKDVESLEIVNGWNRITSVKGIEYFVNLKSLTIYKPKLDSLNLIKNTKLEKLTVFTGDDEGVEGTLKYLNVTACKSLKSLDCYGNILSSLDLTKNLALTDLNCSKNSLTQLNVSSNTNLKSLNCSRNQLSALDFRNNRSLENLDFSENRSLTLLDVTKNIQLKEIGCVYTGLKTLDFTGISGLKSLDCFGTKISSLKIPAGLEILNIRGTALSSFDFNQTKMMRVLTIGPELISVDLSVLVDLTQLHSYDLTPINLDLTKNSKLDTLHISNAKISKIDFTDNQNLKSLFLEKMIIDQLDLRPLKQLKACSIHECPNLMSVCVNKVPVSNGADNWYVSGLIKLELCK